MTILNNIPLVGILIGIMLLIIVIPNRKGYVQNRRAKLILVSIIALNTYSQIDSYLYYNDLIDSGWTGISYLYYHLYGVLFYFSVFSLFREQINYKIWGAVILVYTLLRGLFLFTLPDISDRIEADSFLSILFFIDYAIALLLNIAFLVLAYFKLKRINFSVSLTGVEKVNYTWLKRLIIISIIIYVAIIQSDLVSYFTDMALETQFKIESLITNIFFFAMAYFAIRFPIFSIYGDFKDDTTTAGIKYAKSSLKSSESNELWNKIQVVMKDDKAYRNPEYRLNDLSSSAGKSLHHVSQVINEKTGMSFSDFVNKFRVEEAKELLVSSKTSYFTILAIAYDVGFNSKTTFYNTFKKECGITPTRYRRNSEK